nr:extensin family protein [Pseudohoeflea sp. DP4N28-3]
MTRGASARGGRAVAIFALGAFVTACSGEMVPPTDVLSFAAEPAPMLAPAAMAPVGLAPTILDASYPLDAPLSGPYASEAPLGPVQYGAQQASPIAEPQPVQERRLALLPRISNPLARPEWAGGMPASERNCRAQLKRLGVVYEDIDPIGNGRSCGIAHPVKVSGLSGGIRVKPAAKLNCQMTLAFAKWVKEELGPAARARYFSGVKEIKQMSSYSCRTMNSRRGAPMSEHSKGNAIDVGAVTLDNGHTIDVRDPGFFAFREKSLLTTVREDSCKYFNTVLGPGSDRYHKDHFHFDLRARKSGRRHCSL